MVRPVRLEDRRWRALEQCRWRGHRRKMWQSTGGERNGQVDDHAENDLPGEDKADVSFNNGFLNKAVGQAYIREKVAESNDDRADCK